MDFNTQRSKLYAQLQGQLIVSVQAPDGHAMRDTHTLTHVAAACVDGGAPAIRCGGYGGLEDIRSISNRVDVPVFMMNMFRSSVEDSRLVVSVSFS